MKYDRSGKISRSAGRALTAFSEALLSLLEKRAFEDITVQELCNTADYPHSTFYNYFDDIYDLLGYCWDRLSQGLTARGYEEYPAQQRMYALFDDLYTQFEAQREALNRMFQANQAGGKFVEFIARRLRQDLHAIISEYPVESTVPIRGEMLAEHCSNVLQMVFEWSFLREDGLSREEANEALRYLFGGLAAT